MKKHLYIGLIVFAILVLALGRLVVRLPVTVLGATRRHRLPAAGDGLSTQFSTRLS